MRGYDPLSVRCPYCCRRAGERCSTTSARPRAAHAARRLIALAVAAHADPALDDWPQLGPVSPCGICGVPQMPQRHRMVDAMAERMEAGETADDVAWDYQLPIEVARAVQAWAAKWPGAW